jgi:hypothetical protein
MDGLAGQEMCHHQKMYSRDAEKKGEHDQYDIARFCSLV